MPFGRPTIATLLCGLATCSGPSGAQEPVPDPNQVIEAYLSRWHETGRFDGVVLVARGDEALYQGAFGLADPMRRPARR